MLIQALCEYYDILAKNGKILSDEFSYVNVNYIVYITEDGKIDHLFECEKNTKEIMPKRTEKPAICSNIIEHRPLYIFGLNFEKGVLKTAEKAEKSHADFVKTNLEFLEGLNSPVVNAYRNFIKNWNPEEEKENANLIKLEKKYNTSNFAFCLVGHMGELLHKDEEVLNKWKKMYWELESDQSNVVIAQCAVTGEKNKIARIHDKIKGIAGGSTTGTGLVSYNNPSENSYGKEQAYNSNISENVMRKYTKALNYIMDSEKNKKFFDDITVVHWAMSEKQECDDLMSALLFQDSDSSDTLDADRTERMFSAMLDDAKKGVITPKRISSITGIGEDVMYYIAGFKPNSSRISLKFIFKRKAADILINIAQHQLDMQISENMKPIPFWVIKKELLSPKSKKQKVNPDLLTRIFNSAIYGTDYPQALLYDIIQRVKIDTSSGTEDKSNKEGKTAKNPFNRNRAGIIKACINRRARILYNKEEFKLSLDKQNKEPAYLCGRLFAVLEKLQMDASETELNTTIKDAYFASAASNPSIVFPKILKLAQNHMKKSKRPKYYNILICEIIDKLENDFPNTLALNDQGRFMIGYYQQYQSFFIKNDEKNENDEEE